MSYVSRFPKKYHGTRWLFWVISRFQLKNPTHREHPDDCRCDGCFTQPDKGQMELIYGTR